MKKYIFLWSGNRTKCGSSSVCRVDGRLSIDNIIEEGYKVAKKTNCTGFSVGYLVSHDPDEIYSQKIVKLINL